MPDEEAWRATLHRQTDRRRHRLVAFLGSVLLIGFVLQLGYFVIARELFPLGAAPPLLYPMEDLDENDTFWLGLETDAFPEWYLNLTLLQTTNSSDLIVETKTPTRDIAQIESTLSFYTKNFTYLGTKATSTLNFDDTASTWRNQAVTRDIINTEAEPRTQSGQTYNSSITSNFKIPISTRDYLPVTLSGHLNTNFNRSSPNTSFWEAQNQTKTDVEEAGDQFNTAYEETGYEETGYEETGHEETAKAYENDVEETYLEPSVVEDDVVENHQDYRNDVEKTQFISNLHNKTVRWQLVTNNENSSAPISARPFPSPLERVLPTLNASATSPPARSRTIEETAVDLHRREWEIINNRSFCRNWRLERQNWTAIMTGHISQNRSTSCPNPYNHKSVKRILFQNFSEELIGCTRHTPRCSERATFSEEFNIRLNVPPCCLRHLLEIYRHIETELTKLKVTHFMIGGGVIGWMRNKRMVPYDDDLDVLVPYDFWKTDAFWKFVRRMRRIHRMPCRLVEETKMKIYYSEFNEINVDMWPYFYVHKKKKRQTRRARKARISRTLRRNKKRRRSKVRRPRRKVKTSSRKKRALKVSKMKRRRKKYEVETMIDIPYKNFKLQPPSNLLPPKQVVFENFLVFIPSKPKAYLDRQYGEGKWEHELTCRTVDSDNTCEE